MLSAYNNDTLCVERDINLNCELTYRRSKRFRKTKV